MKKPYYKAGKHNAWFYDTEVIEDGKPKRRPVRLTDRCKKNDDSESEAFERWEEKRKQQPAETSAGTVNALVVKFLEWDKEQVRLGKLDQTTHQFYWTHCTAFADLFGQKLVDDVSHDDLDAWLDSKGKPRIDKNGKPTAGVTYRGRSDDYRANACRALARAFNWGRKRKPRLCVTSPLEDYERPVSQPRDVYLTPDEWDRFFSFITDPHFFSIATFLRTTGARPREARILTKREWDGDRTLTYTRRDSKGKRRKRVVYLPQQAAEIVARLAAERPEGPLFTTATGKPWNRHALGRAFTKVAKRAGLPATSYVMRHSWVTDGLEKHDSATVAKLAGHTSSAMIEKVYGHRDRHPQSLIDAAERAIAR